MAARVLQSERFGSKVRRRGQELRRVRVLCVTASAVGLVLLAGCASGQPTDGVTAPVLATPAVEATENTMLNAPAAMIEAVLDDAASRSGTPRAEIKLLSAEAVTWSDGSLGCPVPGMLYTQALVPGYRILVQADGKQLHYHAGMQGMARFCPADRIGVPLPGDRI